VNFLTLTFIKVRKAECKNWKLKTILSSKYFILQLTIFYR
jgi:hypothetical protein